ncbi:MAG TPA: hypothetical protein VF069_21710 [Streptosporangiaceae bacterium]
MSRLLEGLGGGFRRLVTTVPACALPSVVHADKEPRASSGGPPCFSLWWRAAATSEVNACATTTGETCLLIALVTGGG